MKNLNFAPFCLLLLLFFSPNLPAQLFEDASDRLPDNGARGQSMDVQAADLDGDGDLDIVLANEFQANTLLFNDGEGRFTNGSQRLPQEVHDSEDVAIADYDRDGDLDLFFCSEDDVTLGWLNVHEFYLNDGEGNFSPAPAYQLPDTKANAIIAVHIDEDEYPDLVLGNDGQNRLFINNGDNTFTEETADRLPAIQDVTQDINAADVDSDGDLDLFIGNEDGNRLLINDGSGVFVDESASRLPQGLNLETRKATFADVDKNGSLDVFLSNVSFIPGRDRQNRLFLNDGNGFFSDVSSTHLPTEAEYTLDAVFCDLDEDGDLDLVSTGIDIVGNSISILPLKAYLNDGQGKFTEATEAVLGDLYGLKGLGVITADLNGDGMPDIYACDRKDNAVNTKDVLLFKKKLIDKVSVLPDGNDVSYRLYPNPVEDWFTVSRGEPLSENPDFYLLDAQGKLLGQIHPEEKQKGQRWYFDRNLVSPELLSGNYFLLIQSSAFSSVSLPLIVTE